MSSSASKWVRNASDEAAVDQGCRFDLARADRVRQFCAKFLRHSKGEWAGKPVEFLDWQWDRVIAPAFGWIMPDGTRRFRRVGLGVPKKNGKSTMLSALALYYLLADHEPGAEIYSAASDREQARIIYNEAANMAESSPALLKALRIRRSTSRIEHLKSRSVYKALSAEANTKEGYNIHALLFDELHSQPNDDLWNVLKFGGAARRQPMLWWISTAGEDDETQLWHRQFAYARRVQSGEHVDIGYLGVVYGIDKDDDWTQEAVWKKANPSYGYTINKRDMHEACEEAKANPADRVTFLRYRLNLATKPESRWLDRKYWDACGESYTLADCKKLECVAGFDLAETTDFVAFVLVFRDGDGFRLWPMFWVSETAVKGREQSNRQRYEPWIASKRMTMTTGEPVVDTRVVRKDIVQAARAVGLPRVVVDRYHATQVCYQLRRDFKKRGMKTKLEFARFNALTVSPALKELTRLILCGKVKHPRNPVLDWMFDNVIVHTDQAGNQRPDRGKSKDKIDGIAATLLGLAAIMEEDKQASKYDKQGLDHV